MEAGVLSPVFIQKSKNPAAPTIYGELSEWPMVTDLKSVGVQAPVGSNPTLSAIMRT